MYNYLILYAIKQLKGQRSTASIYHIISGRRSAQTIQDAHFYQMTHFYSIYHQLKRKEFEKSISTLNNEKLIEISDQEIASLTKEGQSYINAHVENYPIDQFKGLDYTSKSTHFIDRLSLTIQTYANLSMNNRNFQPVSDRLDVQKWFKQYYTKHQSINSWLTSVYKHLHAFLSDINRQQAKLFVDRLTGYRTYGLSIQQLAMKYQLSDHDVHLILTLSSHQLINFIETKQITLLQQVIPDDHHQLDQFLTNSALRTYQSISKGYTLEEIMQIRHLKRSTIEDHIVELTYAIPEIDLTPYISQVELNDLWAKIKHLDDHRLAKVKATLDNQYSYFQIRLALAKLKLIRH